MNDADCSSPLIIIRNRRAVRRKKKDPNGIDPPVPSWRPSRGFSPILSYSRSIFHLSPARGLTTRGAFADDDGRPLRRPRGGGDAAPTFSYARATAGTAHGAAVRCPLARSRFVPPLFVLLFSSPASGRASGRTMWTTAVFPVLFARASSRILVGRRREVWKDGGGCCEEGKTIRGTRWGGPSNTNGIARSSIGTIAALEIDVGFIGLPRRDIPRGGELRHRSPLVFPPASWRASNRFVQTTRAVEYSATVHFGRLACP